MKFTPTPLKDAWVLELEPRGDERGYFARTFCAREFEAHGLDPTVVQSNTSYSRDAGTLRVMHWQRPPAEETKLMRCIRGRIYDAIIDLRPDSPSYLRHFGVELSAENRKMLYVPKGFAHGFMTLEDHCETLYLVGAYYTPGAEDGLRHDDPKFGIAWPREAAVISEKDRSWPLFDERT